MRQTIKSITSFIFLAIFATLVPATAADQQADWEVQVRKADEAYWNDFNFGASAALNSHLAKDVEFYHDLGGIVLGYEALADVNSGMDNTKNRGRRAVIADTLRIFPMRRGNEVYGAIVIGDHEFFSTDAGKIVKKTFQSSFTHLMLLKDGDWKVARIYSYNHQMPVDVKK